MTSSCLLRRTLTTSLFAVGVSLCCAITASADLGLPEPPPPGPAAVGVPVALEASGPVETGCRQFDAVLRISSAYYNDFVYAIAGNGADVDYRDPKVQGENVEGRTALRKAAGEAMSVASAPGLPPVIADPMRSWSWHAAKLAMVMGIRADGDTLDNAATELNNDAERTQMACANAGVRPTISHQR